MNRVDIQREVAVATPGDDTISETIDKALALSLAAGIDKEVSVRLVDQDEMRQLNQRFRDRDYATNVLSFPAEFPDELELPLIGDIVVCAPVVIEEAHAQGKALDAHWDHMLVHGVLHLLGYDHENDDEASVMESLETRILAQLGWPDPYATAATDAQVCP